MFDMTALRIRATEKSIAFDKITAGQNFNDIVCHFFPNIGFVFDVVIPPSIIVL